MAYHISNLGVAAHRVSTYQDLSGFVPEPGDDKDTFHYPQGSYSMDEDEWRLWCADAAAATGEAQAELDRRNGVTDGSA